MRMWQDELLTRDECRHRWARCQIIPPWVQDGAGWNLSQPSETFWTSELEQNFIWPDRPLNFFFTASSSVWFRQKWLSCSQNPRRQPFLWIFVSSRDAKGIWYWRFSSFVCSFHNLHSAPLITCFSILHKTRGARWVKDAPNKWDAILLGLILGQYLNIFCRKAAGLSFVYSLFLISVV